MMVSSTVSGIWRTSVPIPDLWLNSCVDSDHVISALWVHPWLFLPSCLVLSVGDEVEVQAILPPCRKGFAWCLKLWSWGRKFWSVECGGWRYELWRIWKAMKNGSVSKSRLWSDGCVTLGKSCIRNLNFYTCKMGTIAALTLPSCYEDWMRWWM